MALRFGEIAVTRSPFSVDHSFSDRLLLVCRLGAYCALLLFFPASVLGDDSPILNVRVGQSGASAASVSCLQRDHDGNLWFVAGGEVHRYDGSKMVAWSGRIGLPSDDRCLLMRRDSHGAMWILSERQAIYRFDGLTLTNVYNAPPGQVISNLHVDSDRTVWFGVRDGALYHYNGASLRAYSVERGLSVASDHHVVRTQDGQLWTGLTHSNPRTGALFLFDEKRFRNVTLERGWGESAVNAVGALIHGGFWAATDRGLVHYDGEHFQRFTRAEGLAHDRALAGFVSSDGRLWCGTEAGVSQFDGIAWASLGAHDGLAGVSVNSITEDDERDVWFATEAGLSRYRRNPTPPVARIHALEAGESYSELSALPGFVAGTRITFSFESIDPKTPPERRQYRCRIAKGIRGADELDPGPDSPEHRNWLSPGKETTFQWTPTRSGAYTFAVQAIDRDLIYSSPAVLVVSIVPPWYLKAEFIGWFGGSLLAVGLLSTFRYVRSRRRRIPVCARRIS